MEASPAGVAIVVVMAGVAEVARQAARVEGRKVAKEGMQEAAVKAATVVQEGGVEERRGGNGGRAGGGSDGGG